MILDCNGELFFATHTIETYLGFHQSDVIHQSVYELVHSEDREELQRQLGWISFMGSGSSGSGENSNLSLQELLSPEHNHLLDRSFTVRFRCLLDNTSGFLVRPNSTSLLKNLLHKKHERLEGDEKAKSKGEISVGFRAGGASAKKYWGSRFPTITKPPKIPSYKKQLFFCLHLHINGAIVSKY